jgi:hypothetical protein
MNHLKPDKIVQTITVLRQRISERFPQSGLFDLCGHLLEISKVAEAKSKWFRAPVFWLRALCWLISILIIAGSVGTILLVHEESTTTTQTTETTTADEAETEDSGFSLTELVQVVEAGINDIVLIGAAIFFLMTLETRYKRGRALEAIHELRSIAHIIDMHQLTKDPERIINPAYSTTANSPVTNMTRFELRRYFDYCSEMLSLTGKIAAVYVQDFNDSAALASVNEVETLCTGLSRKIWQKASILHEVEECYDQTNETRTPQALEAGSKTDPAE